MMGKFFGQILPSSSFLISIALIYLHLGNSEDKDKDKGKDWQRDEREISYIANLIDPPAGNLNRCQCCLIKRLIVFNCIIIHQMIWIIHPQNIFRYNFSNINNENPTADLKPLLGQYGQLGQVADLFKV